MTRTTDRYLKTISLIFLVIIGVSGVYAARGLYADGAYWLVEMLPRGGFYIFDPHRAYVQMMVQAPVAIAIWLGVQDLSSLIRLHSFGFVCVPLLCWFAALALQFKSRLFWFFLMAFSVSYLRSNFFAAGEFSVAYGMTAFCTSVLLREQISRLQAIAMLLTATVLTHSYEATMFLGLFLAALVAIRLRKVSIDSRSVRFLLNVSFLVFLVSVYVGARSTFFERAYNGKGAANLSAFTEIHLLYLMAMPALIATIAISLPHRIRTWMATGITLMAICYMAYIFRWDQTNISYGFLSYAYRTLCCFLLLGVLSVAVAFQFWPSFFMMKAGHNAANGYLVQGAMIFFVTMVGPLLYHTLGYSKWLQKFEQTAVSLTEHKAIDKTNINSNSGMMHGYNWGWGNPSLSILLRGNAEAMVLNHSDNTGTAEPSVYENIKPDGGKIPTQKPLLDLYPLKPFEKRAPLF
jgi:hypothetical protein